MTETMEGSPDIGLDSYDRFFPNQDTMPHGGFGNLIALPLQKGTRKQDNSVFLDDDFVPWTDRAFLASVRKLGEPRSNALSRKPNDAAHPRRRLPPQEDGEAEPWTATPSRHRKDTDRRGFSIDGGTGPGQSDLRRQARVASRPSKPVASARGISESRVLQSSGDAAVDLHKPRVVACAEDHPHHIGLPRGCLDDIRQTLTDLGIRPAIRDERRDGSRLERRFKASSGRSRRPATRCCATRLDTGRHNGFGKTVVAAWLIAQRGVNTLVLVHRRQLLDQWIERLSTFLDMPAKSIGRIGGGRSDRLGCSTSPSFRASSEKVSSMTASPGTASDRRRMPSPVGAQFRAGGPPGQSPIRRGVVGDSRTQGRPPSDHLHAVRSGSPSGNARAQAAARPFEHSSLCSRRRSSRQKSRSGQTRRVPGALSRVGRRRDADSTDLRGRRRVRARGRSPLS